MSRAPRWLRMVEAARAEALLAVRLYNDPATGRAFEAFVVHMHVGWLYLLHARFVRDQVDIRYRDRNDPERFIVVDGEYKRWELGKCVEERWPDDHQPTRQNLEFFIALRNRIEHRYMHSADRELAEAVGGHAHALLLNFEQELTSTFGLEFSLATALRFPLFIGTFTTEGRDALVALRERLPADLKRFIAEYHVGLPDDVATDSRFELRLNVVLQLARGNDGLAIEFMRWDDMTDEDKAAALQLGKKGQTIVREQQRRIVGHGLLKPREAEQQVAIAIPFIFNSHHFLRAWQIKKIRPRRGDPNPERTDEKYCVYDALGRSYGYTDAWVKWLVKHCSTENGFEAVTGREARPK